MQAKWPIAAGALAAAAFLLGTALAPGETAHLPKVEPLWSQPQPVSSFAYDGRWLWATLDGEPTICQLDARTGAVKRRLAFVTPDTGGSAWDGRWLWQIAYKDKTIHKLDLASGRSLGTIPTPGRGMCCGMTFDGRYLWVANFEDARLYQIDQNDGGRVLRAMRGLFESTGLAWDGRYLWHGILVGTKTHDEATPYTGVVEQRDPAGDGDAVLRVVPLPGVGPGTAEWRPGEARARRFWWYDGYHRRVVRVELPAASGPRRFVAAAVLLAGGIAAVFWRGRRP